MKQGVPVWEYMSENKEDTDAENTMTLIRTPNNRYMYIPLYHHPIIGLIKL